MIPNDSAWQPRALAFHHVDPAQKEFALTQKGVTLSLQALRAEARKCVLLCSNCHAEVEDGFVVPPDTIPGGSARDSAAPELVRSIYLIRGSSIRQSERLLTVRLWVRVPPPELLMTARAR